jgi:hypothetical protein
MTTLQPCTAQNGIKITGECHPACLLLPEMSAEEFQSSRTTSASTSNATRSSSTNAA